MNNIKEKIEDLINQAKDSSTEEFYEVIDRLERFSKIIDATIMSHYPASHKYQLGDLDYASVISADLEYYQAMIDDFILGADRLYDDKRQDERLDRETAMELSSPYLTGRI